MVTDAKRQAAEALLGALPLPENEAGWAREARARARTRLLEAGAPGRRDEYWRQTDPSRLTAPLAPVGPSEEPPAEPAFFGEVSARLARFVNGYWRPDLSDTLPHDGLAAIPLREALGQDIGMAREIFGALEAAGQEKVERPLAALNTAAAEEGLVLHASAPVPDAVHVRQDQIGEGTSLLHHLVRVESGAELTILESGVAGNTVIEVDVAPGGTLHHVRVQEGERMPSATHVFARIGEDATFKSFTLTADGALTRNEVVIELAGDSGSGHIGGAVLGKDATHADNTVFVTHTGQHCESRQVFKNVLADTAKAIFQGKIFVRPGAQKTDGYQISQSVLLDAGAEFSAKPELEIYADDVQCSHGSTTGALDRDALFYMRSRGVPKEEAEALLVLSFIDPAIQEIADERIADAMRERVAAWMGARR
jgi:Fe-S cluster assembly protein SufD